jgi:hypothetical protein
VPLASSHAELGQACSQRVDGGPPSGGAPSQPTTNFCLREKVPRSVWLRLGGYPGWLIEVNHRDERVDNGDLGVLRQLIAELPRQ